MASYSGFYAELYDLIYAEKRYDLEAEFLHGLVNRNLKTSAIGKRLLDMACGTGSHAFQFERIGYTVHAFDQSSAVIEEAKKKGSRLKSQVHFAEADMTQFALNIEKFDVVTCLFDSIGYVRTNSNFVSVLRNVRDHLKDSGTFVFEFWHAPAMLRHHDPVRVRRWDLPGGELLRIAETSIEWAAQLCHVKYNLYFLNSDKTFLHHEETQINRCFTIEEIRALLELGGFRLTEVYPGFAIEGQISDQTWHILACAEKI